MLHYHIRRIVASTLAAYRIRKPFDCSIALLANTHHFIALITKRLKRIGKVTVLRKKCVYDKRPAPISVFLLFGIREPKRIILQNLIAKLNKIEILTCIYIIPAGFEHLVKSILCHEQTFIGLFALKLLNLHKIICRILKKQNEIIEIAAIAYLI